MLQFKSLPNQNKIVKNSNSQGSPLTSPARPYIVQKDWVADLVSSPAASSDDSFDSLGASPVKLPGPKPRRRLVQGRRPRQPSFSSSPVKPTATATPVRPTIIDLVSDDEEDDDDFKLVRQASREATPESPEESSSEKEFNNRVLNYLNNCDVVQLMAIANVKDEHAKVMLSHQPFANLEAAKNVSISQKKQKRSQKSARVAIGSDIVSSIKEYTRALDGIDHIIAVCDKRAEQIKAVTSTWKVDVTGQPRLETKDEDGKLTPMSMRGSPVLTDLPLRQPKYMKGHCTMKSFQEYGLNWMYLLYEKGYGGILADDMGLGKTCQVISLMCSIVEDWESNGGAEDDVNRPWPNIIFVPPSTLANWRAEFERFAPGLNVTIYGGSQTERDEIAEEIQEDPASHHVVLASYSQVSRPNDIANLRRLRPIVTVYDEGHKMKNPKTKNYKDLLRVTSTWRLILSGTPVQNNLMEMVALLQFVEPDLFTDHAEDLEALFNQKASLAAVSQGALLRTERVARARTILEPFILQRRKEQVLKDLPLKTARVVYCEMEETQSAIYREYERRFKKSSLPDSAEQKGRQNDNNNVWIQLRKSAIHPQLFRRSFTDEDVEKMAKLLMRKVDQSELKQPHLHHLIDELKALSDFELHLWCRDYKFLRGFDIPEDSWMEASKVKALLGLIRGYQANGDRVLVFTRFAKVIEILGECLASEGISHLSLQGSTDVSERQVLIDEFTNDKTIPVFLLTTGSGGTGINLTAANKVVIFDQSDNPQDDVQAENRAHRLGQNKPVEVIRLISKGTVEELVYKACQKKLELANKVVGYNVEMTQSDMEAAVRDEMNKNGIRTPSDSD